MPDRDLAATFRHAGVAAAYRHRPPYPTEVLDLLVALAGPPPRAVLDLGAGEEALARPLAVRVERVDAVEVSAAMAAAGRRRPPVPPCTGASSPPRPPPRSGRTPSSPPAPACTGWTPGRCSPGSVTC